MLEHGSRPEWSVRVLVALRVASDRAVSRVRAHAFVLLSLSLIAAAAFAARFLALAAYPAPPGADYGNYLTNLHAFLGQDVTGDGLGYPTVFIAYLVVVTAALGELGGLQVGAPLLAALFCVPSYLLLRTFVDSRFALLGTAMLTFSESVSELIGWGGNPNLLGLLFGTAFFAFFARWLKGGRTADLIGGTVSFGLLAGSHQISLAYFGSAVLATLAVLLVRGRGERDLVVRGGMGLGAGLLATAPFLAFYVRVNEASSYLFPTRPIVLTADDFAFIVSWMFREALLIWVVFIVLAALGLYRIRRTDPVGFSVGVALLATPFLLAATVMALHPIRPLYFLSIGIVVGAMRFLQDGWRPRFGIPRRRPGGTRALVAATILVVGFCLVLVTTSHARMVQATGWYMVMTEDVLDGVEWIRDHTPAHEAIATSGPVKYGAEDPAGCTWGWWIEGYGRRMSLCTGDLQTLAWDAQVHRSRDANRAFMGLVSAENGLVQLGDVAPHGSRGNPLIYGEFGRGYEPLVFLSDMGVEIAWHEPGHEPRMDRPFLMPATWLNDTATPGGVRLEYSATTDGLTVRRTVELVRGSGTVWVNYSFDSRGVLDRIGLSVYSTSRSRLNAFDAATHTLAIGGEKGFRDAVGGRVTLETRTEAFVGSVADTGPAGELPHVRFELAPGTGRFEAALSVHVDHPAEAVPGPVETFRSRDIFDAYEVGFVLVDRWRVREMEWFTRESAAYRIAYENAAIVIFERMR